jgi:hypothetical protein
MLACVSVDIKSKSTTSWRFRPSITFRCYFLTVLAANKFIGGQFSDQFWPPVNSSFLLFIGGFGHFLRAFGRHSIIIFV